MASQAYIYFVCSWKPKDVLKENWHVEYWKLRPSRCEFSIYMYSLDLHVPSSPQYIHVRMWGEDLEERKENTHEAAIEPHWIYKYSRRQGAICPGHLASPLGLPDCNPITSHTPFSLDAIVASLSLSISLDRFVPPYIFDTPISLHSQPTITHIFTFFSSRTSLVSSESLLFLHSLPLLCFKQKLSLSSYIRSLTRIGQFFHFFLLLYT